MGTSVVVAHLSDLHVGLGADHDLFGRDPLASLDAVLGAVREARPAAVVLTGDLTDAGDIASTQYVADRVCDLSPVVRWLAGNHDLPESLDAVQRSWREPAVVGDWTLIPTDSFVPTQWYGHLEDAELARVDSVLASMSTPFALLAVHQPALGICEAAGCRLDNPGALFDLVAAHPGVRAVISGHQHQPFVHERDGVTYVGAGSTCTQVEHVGDGFAPRDNGPMYGLLRLGSDGSVGVEQCELAALAVAHEVTEPLGL